MIIEYDEEHVRSTADFMLQLWDPEFAGIRAAEYVKLNESSPVKAAFWQRVLAELSKSEDQQEVPE